MAHRTRAAACAAALLLTALAAAPAHAAGTVLHVDNRPGSHCSDTGPATAEQPWCTFTPVNSRTFGPGDSLLLARGAAWAQGMVLTGSGTEAEPIEAGAYGSGAPPQIRKGDATAGITLTNASHWALRDLDIDGSSAGQKLVHGIAVRYNGTAGLGHAGLTFAGLRIHHTQIGLSIAGDADPPAGQWALKGLTATRIEGTHNEVSIALGDNRVGTRFIQDAVLTHLNLNNDDGAPRPLKGCPNALTLQSATHLTVMDSLISHAGGCAVATGTTGIYLGRVSGATLTNNIVAYTQQTASPDQSGVDLEGWTDGTALRGNLITGNVGWGVELQAIHTGGPNTGVTVDSNALAFNGRNPLAALGSATASTGEIHDNLWQGTALLDRVGGASTTGLDIAGNAGPATGDRIWYAARDFATGQDVYGWHYQYSADAGATWKDLRYGAADGTWRPAGGTTLPMANTWDWQPASQPGSYLARAWTAPRDGTVAVRGQAAKADLGGDGVRVRITDNGKQILGPAALAGSDRTGTPTDVDALHVHAGDTLRFIVDPGPAGDDAHDTTSWTPAIGYQE